MKEKKHSLHVFIASVFLCAGLAVIAYFATDTREKFQQKAIPSPLLSYGETGKILRELDAILPLEDKSSSSALQTNTIDFAERAARERKKWLLLENYKQFSERGIFGYIEMHSPEADVPFQVFSTVDETWKTVVDSRVRPGKVAYPFFIDGNDQTVDLQLRFSNVKDPVVITGMAFFQDGFHPLIYTDPIAFNSFFRDGSINETSIHRYGVHVPSSDTTKRFQGRLPFQLETLAGISNYQKKQGKTKVQLIARNNHPLLQNIKRTDKYLAETSKTKISVIAIDVNEDDLHSEEHGILKNYDGHGRRWERLSYVRFYRDGKNIFSNFSGLRLQGGDPGRAKGLLNFRVFFREEYGKSMIDGSKLFDGSAGDIKRLAIKQSEWPKWPLNSPIAYDVSRQMGVLAPPTEMVLLYLNGKELGLYYLVPHLGEKQIKNILPEDDYNYYRIRGSQHDADKHFITAEFFKNLSTDGLMTEELASQFFDLDNLSRQIFSYMANATGDYCQGIVLKGGSPDSKMFWYSWDMDHSYIDVSVEVKKTSSSTRKRWQAPPSISLGLYKKKPEQRKHHCGRIRLFRQLVNEDPVFREKTKHFFASIMNHQLTQEFFTSLLDDYEKKLQAISYPGGAEYIAILRDFFSHRNQFLLQEMSTEFPAEDPVICHVSANSYPIKVDGFIKNGPYEGHYFPGAKLQLASTPDNAVRYWRINGEKVGADTANLRIEPGAQCLIEAVH